jgi:hypothetical protein
MATLVLGAAGSALGGAFGGSIGANLGRAAGAIAGQFIDGALFGQSKKVEGPRLNDLDVQASTEGAPIPRVYGRARLAGQMIWATRYEEVVTVQKSSGGKGGPKVTSTTYSYFANFALGLCEGQISRIGRIWADGKLLDTDTVTMRWYHGSETQNPDPLIAAKQGDAPAYRGLAYIVFERLPIEAYGNRIPQITVEVIRALPGLEDDVKAITMIPGSTEFGYQPVRVTRQPTPGVTESENRHSYSGNSDWAASLDELQALCPNLERVGLVVSWFGDDLRADQCLIEPRVENATKQTTGETWAVAGLTRAGAKTVSTVSNRPAFGGSPSDASVIAAIQNLKARGLKITFIPFIMMDVPAGNTLSDPYTGASSQPVYPWRGRITCNPAPGQPGTPDKTATAASQLASLIGTADVADFSISGNAVNYTGPNEWSFRRFILHCANLCKAAGGVDAFVLGSELKGLTSVRDSATSFPFVSSLVNLAGDVRSILGVSTVLTYGADWSEYANYRPDDGSDDVLFHLDPLWASPNVDVIGIDNYLPLSDWRDGEDHLDAGNYKTVYDRAYLEANIAGGEYKDWFYASQSDREAQTRTDVTDGAYGKPWVYAPKDLKAWWENSHVNRIGGVEAGSATAYQPEAKPFWFIELGCPAVHLGANQPNVFPDPKSSESAFPYFSDGTRDDAMQRRFLEAHIAHWSETDTANNPLSSVDGRAMVDPDTLHFWAWDSRPFPWFPYATNVWSDGANWHTGHWLNGRLGAITLEALVKAIAADYGISDIATENLETVIDGYVIDRPMSMRAAIESLARLFTFSGIEREGVMTFAKRGLGEAFSQSRSELAAEGDAPLLSRTRAQETELPSSLSIGFTDGVVDYRRGLSRSRRLIGQSARETAFETATIAEAGLVDRSAEIVLQDIWAGRETLTFSLPPSALSLEPGDRIDITGASRPLTLEITRINDRDLREVEARVVEPSLFTRSAYSARNITLASPVVFGAPEIISLDLPVNGNEATGHGARIAIYAKPWPGTVALLSSPSDTGFELVQRLDRPATTGILIASLEAGPVGLIDHGNTIEVSLRDGALSSIDTISLLSGRNLAAVSTAMGWEVLQFQTAELVAVDTWRLSGLLRGLGGTDDQMSHDSGARFILLDEAVEALDVALESLGLTRNWRAGSANVDSGDDSYASASFAPGTRGLQPLSPVHVKAETDGAGDVQFSWIRRTRLGGDDWEGDDVPLGEESERYRVEIYDGVTLLRSIDVTDPAATYTATDRTTDLGSSTASFTAHIYQVGTGGRRGVVKEILV